MTDRLSDDNYGLMPGVLQRIMMRDEYILNPVLQIVDISKLPRYNDIYILRMSDGSVESRSCIWLKSNLNNLIEEKNITENSIIRIKSYDLEEINYKSIMTINSLEILASPSSRVYIKHDTKELIPYPTMAGKPVRRPPTFLVKVSDSIIQKAAKEPATPADELSSVAQPPEFENAPAPSKPARRSSMGCMLTPISALRSDQSNRCAINARVTKKSAICQFSNSRGIGRYFNVNLLDESGEIKCTAYFKECDKFYNLIENGQVYTISKFSIKPANKCYSQNDYEITLRSDSKIDLCCEDNVPNIKFNFLPIRSIQSTPNDVLIDVVGIVKVSGDASTFNAKNTYKKYTKRELGLVDENNDLINVTLWGEEALNFNGSENPVVAIKGAKISEFFGEKKLSTLTSSVLLTDPDIPEAHKLQEWFTKIGSLIAPKLCVTPSLKLGDIAKSVRHQEIPNVFYVKAMINRIREDNALYMSCLLDTCKKKVNKQNNGMYKCEKCKKEYSNFTYRLLANVNLVDWTGNQWVTAFNEEAEVLFKTTGPELGLLQETDYDAFIKKISKALFKSYNFKLRMNQETFNGKTQLRATVFSVEPIIYKDYTDQLLDEIQKLISI